MVDKAIKTIDFDGFTAQLIRSRRKSAVINIRDGIVAVRVPMRFPLTAIQSFVESKNAWIKRHLDQQQQVQAVNKRKFVDGERFNYIGKPYVLQTHLADIAHVEQQAESLHVSVPAINNKLIKDALTKWYREQAKGLLTDKVEQFKSSVDVQPEKLTIRSCKSRWGSCSSTGRLMFNWKIMMAPESVIDYLVVHELCHILEHNHSPRFWQQVERVLPNYRSPRKWLKDNGRYLQF